MGVCPYRDTYMIDGAELIGADTFQSMKSMKDNRHMACSDALQHPQMQILGDKATFLGGA